MEEIKAEKRKVERMGLWLYIRRAKARQISRYNQASMRINHFGAAGKGLDR